MSRAKHALPPIKKITEAILQSADSVIGLARCAGVDPPGVSGGTLDLGFTRAAWLVGAAENIKTCFTVADALFL